MPACDKGALEVGMNVQVGVLNIDEEWGLTMENTK
jgi:hypothetical protein